MKKKKKSKTNYRKKKSPTTKPGGPKTRFALKTPEHFQELVALSTKQASENAELGSCWFSDSGGADQCVPLTEDECKSRGGTWTPGPCPNAFLAKGMA
jgi:hypothetical protein